MSEFLSRYYHTGKHLKPRQVLARLKKLSPFNNVFSPSEFSPSETYRPPGEIHIVPSISLIEARLDRETALQNAERVCGGVFQFVGKKVEYPEEVNWDDTSQGRLWRFNLNYFDYLVDLAYAYRKTGNPRFLQQLEELLESWIDKNRKASGDPWHPYVISRRVINWIYAFALAGEELSEDIRNLLLESLEFQLDYLSNNLEYDLFANHLFSDAKALYIGGKFFGKDKIEDKGGEIISRQLEEQVLPDGGHFERSPTYHCQILMDLLDIISWVSEYEEGKLKRVLVSKSSRMLEFLEGILHPDCTIPLFGDSTLNGAPFPEVIFSYAEELGIGCGKRSNERTRELSDSGYFIVEPEKQFMIIDGGKFGPVYQPGHGHCDLFSYELSLNDKRFITDSGVYEYKEGKMRDYCRGTTAHNTVKVDGVEQSEIWKSFRVARRSRPHDVTLNEEENLCCFSGWHDGYRRLRSGVNHQRKICFIKNRFWLVYDLVEGSGRHEVESYVHFHPDVTLSDEMVAKWGEDEVQILPFGADEVEQGTSDYCPEFGKKIERSMVQFDMEGEVPLKFGYLLVPDAGSVNLGDFDVALEGASLYLTIDGDSYRIEFVDNEVSIVT